MTTNQIAYLKAQEEARHNRATEEQGAKSVEAQLQQAESASRQAGNAYITAQANAKQAEAAMQQSTARWGELQYKYDTIPLYEREVASKEVTAKASATTASANVENARANTRNAESNARNVDVNAKNASTNLANAKVNLYKAIVEDGRVQAFKQQVANELAKTDLEKRRIKKDIDQFAQEYALMEKDYERKRWNDEWNNWLNTFKVISSHKKEFASNFANLLKSVVGTLSFLGG